MITPNDIKNIEMDNICLVELEKKIDTSMMRLHGWYTWEQAIIEGEYSIEVRNEIAKRYKDGGWKYVYHKTSSENDEKYGLTCFIFSNIELEQKYVEKYYKV